MLLRRLLRLLQAGRCCCGRHVRMGRAAAWVLHGQRCCSAGAGAAAAAAGHACHCCQQQRCSDYHECGTKLMRHVPLHGSPLAAAAAVVVLVVAPCAQRALPPLARLALRWRRARTASCKCWALVNAVQAPCVWHLPGERQPTPCLHKSLLQMAIRCSAEMPQ